MTWYHRIAESRPPDVRIGGDTNPYTHRWWLIPRNKVFNIYLHKFLRSDEDRALHDHPWANLSIILDGEYVEELIQHGGVHSYKRYGPHNVRFRRASMAHRIIVDNPPVWTVFITGPVVREWGFHCPNGWRPWFEFLKTRYGGEGPGCGD